MIFGHQKKPTTLHNRGITKPQELEGDHTDRELDKGKGKMFEEDEEEDQVLR